MGTIMITQVTDEKIRIILFLSNWDINSIWSRYIMYSKDKSNYISGQRNYINRLQSMQYLRNDWEPWSRLNYEVIFRFAGYLQYRCFTNLKFEVSSTISAFWDICGSVVIFRCCFVISKISQKLLILISILTKIFLIGRELWCSIDFRYNCFITTPYFFLLFC